MSYKRYTTSCLLCKSEVSTSNLPNHYNSKQCQKLNNTIEKLKFNYFKIICKFCDIETENKRHESLCKLNPNKQIAANQFTIGKENNTPYEWKQESLDKMKKSNTGVKRSTITKSKLSAAMKLAVIKYPKSYCTAKNYRRVKIKICSNGFKVQGSWEESFVEYCLINNIKISQVSESFTYLHENKQHRYFPDFYLDNYDLFVEVKGYKTTLDDSKWNSITTFHNKNLLIIDSKVINQIKNNSICINDILNNYRY